MDPSLEPIKQGLCEFCKKPTEHGPWTDEQLAQLKHMKFMAAGKALQDFRAKHGAAARHMPESIPLFNEFLEHAPPEVVKAFNDKAKELNLIPETKFVNDAGEPVYSAEQIAETLGVPVQQVEKDIREKFGHRLEASKVHQVQ